MSDILNEKIKFALIGCGAIAHKHVIAIKRLNNAEVIGGFDIDVKSAKLFEEKYQIPAFTNVDEMISKLPPEYQQEVEDFVEFIFQKHIKKTGRKFRLDWAGGLKEYKNKFTSLELQKKALECWGD